MDRWMDGWVDGWTGGWMDIYTNTILTNETVGIGAM